MSAPNVNVPIGDLLQMAKQVIATADRQSRDLSDAEAIKVETLLDLAERYTTEENNRE